MTMSGIALIKYNNVTSEKRYVGLSELLTVDLDVNYNWWIAIDNLDDQDLIQAIGNKFDINQFMLENSMNRAARPNIDIYHKHTVIVTKRIFLNHEGKTDIEHVALVIGKNYVLSFSENGIADFDDLFDRLTEEDAKNDKNNFLCYMILDFIVDKYLLVMEDISDRIEDVEKTVIADPSPEAMENIHSLKKELLLLHKAVWPQREIISTILRKKSSLSEDGMDEYYRDIYEHLFMIVDLIEVFRDMLSTMFDIYLSSSSIKMNEIMKILTIISTIFMPLTFLTGLYGMNFINIPELRMRYGYFALLLIMAILTIGMINYFRKKKWI